MKKYAGEEFLNRLYKDLVNSPGVLKAGKGGNKNEDLALYFARLERVHQRAIENDKLSLLKLYYYENYVIKADDVPESHFKRQEQSALEQGYGHVTYNEYAKKEEIKTIINEQKESLDKWLDYFVSEDTKHYSTWFKYYVFQNVMKIGYFDKEKNEFTKRTNITVKPFIELNMEAIAMLYDELCKYLDKQKVTDEQLEQLIKNGSFRKIYSYIIRKLDGVKRIDSKSSEGIWKKYDQGSDPEILLNDIYGKGTGWCTAGGIETATAHLNGGDFYVYYTKDENDEYTCPRIAIRMEANAIVEVRGISANQNLENEMESIVEEKLNEFPDKEKYKKKVSDMKELTKIYNKYKNEELIKEELRFLYEMDSKIIGFGYEDDPRIEEIKSSRYLRKDIAIMFDMKIDEVSTNEKEALSGNIKFHYGNLDLSSLTSAKGLVLPEKVGGSLKLSGLTNAKEVVLPKEVSGNLDLRSLTNAKGVVLPKEVGGDLYLDSLTSAEGLVLPRKIGESLILKSLTSAKGLILPEKLSGIIILSGLTNAEGLVLPKEVGRDLFLNSLTSAEGLVLPKEVGGDLCLNSLTSAEGLVLPKEVNRILDLSGLTSAKGLILPEKLSGIILLSGLIRAEGLVLPKEVGRDLYLNSLISAEGLVLPEKVGGDLYLNSLTSVEGLVLPEQLGVLILNNSINTEGLMLSKYDSDGNNIHYIQSKELNKSAEITESRKH